MPFLLKETYRRSERTLVEESGTLELRSAGELRCPCSEADTEYYDLLKVQCAPPTVPVVGSRVSQGFER